jgi:mRNA interferase RelE/StbE
MKKLDKSVARRIAERIRWLAANLVELKPEPLTGDLSGFYKLRAGDYRVLYQIFEEEEIIVIHMVGHRREVYRRR